MLFNILLSINILICLALVGVVLLQRSEGGALGMGGGPTGFMSARGAGDLLTRTTWILFTTFLIISLTLTLLSGRNAANSSITSKLKIGGVDPNSLKVPVTPAAPVPTTTPDQSQPPPAQGLGAPLPSLSPLLPAAPAAPAPKP